MAKPKQDEMSDWIVSFKADIIVIIKSEVEASTERVMHKMQTQLKQSLDYIMSKYSEIKQNGVALAKQLSEQQIQINYLPSKCKWTYDRLSRIESYNMRNNLIFTRVDDETVKFI